MTNILTNKDKIFNMYRQYKELILKDVEESGNFVYGTDQLAAQLTVAHMLDHVVCLVKEDNLPTVKEVTKDWKTEEEELEIMRNNAQVASSSVDSSPLRKVLEDFKSDYITLDETIIKINEIPIEEKAPEGQDLKHKTLQYRLDI